MQIVLLFTLLAGCSFFADPSSTVLSASADSGREETGDLDGSQTDAKDEKRTEDATTDPGPSSGEFQDAGDGVSENTTWVSGRLQVVDTGRDGTYISVPYSSTDAKRWTISWRPRAPYGRALPDNGQSDGGYPTGNMDMSGNLLLLEFDGAGAFANGDRVEDLSGNQIDAIAQVDTSLTRNVGVFGQAATFDRADRFDMPSERFVFGFGDFTWSFFARTDSCDGRQRWMGSTTARSSEVWVGCSSDVICPLTNGLSALIRGAQSSGAERCAAARFDDGVWHHIAMIKRGHPDVATELYVDGEAVFTNNVTFLDSEEVLFDGSSPFSVGGVGPDGALGSVDTVAIWDRALTRDEIEAIHDRGLLDVRVDVRGCDDRDCIDEQPWRSAVDPFDNQMNRDSFDGTGIAKVTFEDAQTIQFRVTLIPNANRTPEIEELMVAFEPL